MFMPKNPSGSTHSIDEVAKGLAALPEASLALVKRVDVEPNKNPDDAYWAKEYNDPNFESYMTAGGDGVVNIYPVPQSQDYLDGTMIHETGHILSNTMWGSDTSGKGWDDWKAAAAADKNIPSEYAKSSPAEDFSETLQLYYQVKGTPQEKVERALYLERFKMIDKILADKGSSP
jgi:hypothetical protein